MGCMVCLGMIFYALVSLAAGIVFGLLSYQTVGIWASTFMVIPLFFLFRFQKTRYRVIALLMILGVLEGMWNEYRLFQWQIPRSMIKKPVIENVIITDIPSNTVHGIKFLARVISGAVVPYHTLIQLNWYDPHPLVLVGDHWQLTVNLEPPNGLHNFAAFNYQHWLWRHHIQAVGVVVPHSKAQLTQREVKRSVALWRQQLLIDIQHAVSDADLASFIAALTTGSHALMPPSSWQVFQRTGTNHLIAISGLHIGMAAAFGFLMAGWLGRCFPKLLLLWPLSCWQGISAITIALLYSLMAGFTLPTQRAVIMVASAMLGLVGHQKIAFRYRFILAVSLVIIIDPFALFSMSFWLSFASVFWIQYVNGARLRNYSGVIQWMRLQGALFVGLFPLLLYYFNQVSWLSVLANAIAVPWVGFVIVPLCLFAAASSFFSGLATHALFRAIAFLIKPLWLYLSFLSGISGGIWVHCVYSPWLMMFGVVGAFFLLLPRGIPGRYFGLYLWMPLCLYRPQTPQPNTFWMTVLDVGQGLSVLIQTQHHVLLYDAGPKSYSGFDAGASVVVPYLHYRGITNVDRMMISHGDSDHIGGAYAVLNSVTVGQILTSVPARFHESAFLCYQGQHWQWDGVDFKVLWPLRNASYVDNNSSCVLRVTIGQKHVLLTGDIAQTVEATLVHGSLPLAADILVVPHHGSKTSSSFVFLKAVQPTWAVVSSGLYNHFGLPAQTVVQRYQQLGVILYNTAVTGALFFKISAHTIQSPQTAIEK